MPTGMLMVTSVLGNGQRLDGGAMFGNAPRAVWQRWCPPDALGRIELACRCFLVRDGVRTVLVETGVGAFFHPKLRERYGVMQTEHVLLQSLQAQGIAPEMIDVVFLSHLHFDHAGGLLTRFEPGEELSLVFPHARVLVSEQALARARQPHPRDRASFVPELVPLLERSGRLCVIPEGATGHALLGDRISLRSSSGHTPGMLLPTFEGAARRAMFCADLVPGVAWVHVPLTMGYDRFPELLVDEKQEFFERLGEGSWLLFTHDLEFAAGVLRRDDRGRYFVDQRTPSLAGLDLDVVTAEAD